MSRRILGWRRGLERETEVPRGAEPMGFGAGPEGGDTPHEDPARSLPFLGHPKARTQSVFFKHLLWHCRSSLTFLRTLSPNLSLGWGGNPEAFPLKITGS